MRKTIRNEKEKAQPEEKIANRQLTLLVAIIRSTVAIAFLPVITTGQAGQDGWAAVIFVFWGSVLSAYLIVGLSQRFPQLDIVELSIHLLGPWLGRAIAVFPMWVFLHFAAIELRLYGELLNTAFLPRTPLVFIMGTMVFLAAIAVYLGIEVIGRLADSFVLWIGVSIGASLFLPVPEISLDFFRPTFSRGILPILGSSLTPIGISVQVVTATMIVPNVLQPKAVMKAIYKAILAASILIVLVAAIVVGRLGPFEARRTAFPFITTVRSVTISTFAERLEIFAVLAWGLGLFIGLSVYLYCGAKAVARWFNLRSYRPLIAPMAVIWVVLAVHGFEDVFHLRRFLTPGVFFPYAFVLAVIPFGTLWIAHFWRKITGRRATAKAKGGDS